MVAGSGVADDDALGELVADAAKGAGDEALDPVDSVEEGEVGKRLELVGKAIDEDTEDALSDVEEGALEETKLDTSADGVLLDSPTDDWLLGAALDEGWTLVTKCDEG